MPLLTKKDIAAELSLTLSGIQALTRKRKIPVIRISHTCVRYDLEKVRAALAKFEQKAVA